MIRDHGPDRMANIEQSIVAALLMDPTALEDLVGRLFPSHFANREQRIIYDAMRGLHGRGADVHPTSVVEELRRRKQLTAEREADVHELWGSSGSAATAPWCADQIIEAWRARETMRACLETVRALKEPDADRAVIEDRLQAELAKVGACARLSGPRPMTDDLVEVAVLAEQAARGEGRLRGLSTGFAVLDRALGGLLKGQFVILAARTAFGKSAMAMNIAAHVASQDRGVVVVFSMEMGRAELAARLASAASGVELQRIVNGSLSSHEWVRLMESQSQVAAVGQNLFLDVTGRVTPAVIRSHLRRLARQMPIALVVVDYLQLCGSAQKAESQYVRTTQISGDLKAMAVDLDVPVLALSQLSRDAARRGGEPRLSDLRDSGSIEQDANVVLFIHRESDDMDGGDAASIIVAKNRNGPTGKIAVDWDPLTVRFTDRPRSHVAPGGRS